MNKNEKPATNYDTLIRIGRTVISLPNGEGCTVTEIMVPENIRRRLEMLLTIGALIMLAALWQNIRCLWLAHCACSGAM